MSIKSDEKKITKECLEKVRDALLEDQAASISYLNNLQNETRASYEHHDASYLDGLEDERRL